MGLKLIEYMTFQKPVKMMFIILSAFFFLHICNHIFRVNCRFQSLMNRVIDDAYIPVDNTVPYLS